MTLGQNSRRDLPLPTRAARKNATSGVPEDRDWTPFVEAGLVHGAGPEDDLRRELLEFLVDQGCTLDEMVDAERQGRLFALAGDRIVQPGARTLTLAEVASRIRCDEAIVRRLWRALGLVGWDSGERVASVDDAAALKPIVRAVPIIGEELTLELARTLGDALSRVGDATNALLRSLSPSASVATSGSELDTARYWGQGAPYVASVARLLDACSRHHFHLARDHFERSASYDLMSRRCARLAVGFVDMSGFTTASEELGEVALTRLVTSFSARVGETVKELGGRVVKFVGDAAMIIAPDAPTLATIVGELVTSPTIVGEGLTLHAGLARGDLLNIDGDYFGSAVNIAARLAALADPGAILASAAVGEALSDAGWEVEWLKAQPIRGITAPVVTCLLRHPHEAASSASAAVPPSGSVARP